MNGLAHLGLAVNAAEVRGRECVTPQEHELWGDGGSDVLTYSYHVPGQKIMEAARLVKSGELWDAFDLTNDSQLIGTYHLADCMKAVADWFSVIEELPRAMGVGK